jgi:hypothetical protein
MLAISLAALLPRALAAVFVLAAVVSLGRYRRLTELLSRWDYPRGFQFVLGVFSLLAALFLVLPETRVWGVSLAGLILFGSTISLLGHDRYLPAALCILLMIALPPVLVFGS